MNITEPTDKLHHNIPDMKWAQQHFQTPTQKGLIVLFTFDNVYIMLMKLELQINVVV
jgi:hypothetical protein